MKHDLAPLLSQMQERLASEYARIVSRSQEDPGTAGDQGEENWALFLREWLPQGYHVVTKGRIISTRGEASPQIDVLVLKPSYPPALLNTKLYLSGGVAAAFECKTTLRKAHIEEAAKTAAVVHRMANLGAETASRPSDPYRELNSGTTYGVLAHSHVWTESTATGHVGSAFNAALASASRPREVLDLVCVADLGTWTTMKVSYTGPNLSAWQFDPRSSSFPDGYASVTWLGPPQEGVFPKSEDHFPNIPLAQLCAFITSRLAWGDPSMRSIADYFRLTGLNSNGAGTSRPWALNEAYSPDVAASLRAGATSTPGNWDPWCMVFM